MVYVQRWKDGETKPILLRENLFGDVCFLDLFAWAVPVRENQENRVFEFEIVIKSILAVGSISSSSGSNFRLPLVTISQQLLLVVQQFFTGLGGVFSVGSYNTETH